MPAPAIGGRADAVAAAACDAGGVSPTLTIGRFAGIRIGVNWSWLIVLGLIVWTLERSVFPAAVPHRSHPAYLAMAFVGALLFFGSLLLHELGHAVRARREGLEIEGVTLWLFGGVARFRGMFPSAGAELRIALAGPVVTAAIAAAAVGLVLGSDVGGAVGGVAAWLGYTNLVLLGFNLLPALPLDGGRVLRALLWRRSGELAAATEAAARVARAIAVLVIAAGMLVFLIANAWSGAWLAFVGWFLLEAAHAERRFGLVQAAVGDLRVRDVLVRDPVSVRGDVSLDDFVDVVAAGPHFTTYPVVDGGRIVGLLPFADVARVPRGEWEHTRVGEVMLPLAEVPTVSLDQPLSKAAAEIGAGRLGRALVRDDGHVVGLLSVTDVDRLVAARMSR